MPPGGDGDVRAGRVEETKVDPAPTAGVADADAPVGSDLGRWFAYLNRDGAADQVETIVFARHPKRLGKQRRT